MSDQPLATLLVLQRPSGAFPSTVGTGPDRVDDETCFVTASVALCLIELANAGSSPARVALARALDFVEGCEAADAPGAFGFYPADPATPRVVSRLPADADDTAIAWLALVSSGRRGIVEARTAFRARIGPASRQVISGVAPPWTQPGAVQTWLAEVGPHNPIDLAVNANVAALAARIGETEHSAYRGACDSLLAAARGGYDPTALGRRLAPFYASVCELLLAVARASVLGATVLEPCLGWLSGAHRGLDPLRDDKPLYCDEPGTPVWIAPALQRARKLTTAHSAPRSLV